MWIFSHLSGWTHFECQSLAMGKVFVKQALWAWYWRASLLPHKSLLLKVNVNIHTNLLVCEYLWGYTYTSVWRGQAQEPWETLGLVFLEFFLFPQCLSLPLFGVFCAQPTSASRKYLPMKQLQSDIEPWGQRRSDSTNQASLPSQWSSESRQVFTRTLHLGAETLS